MHQSSEQAGGVPLDRAEPLASSWTMTAPLVRAAACFLLAASGVLVPVAARAQDSASVAPVVTTIAGVVHDSLAARPLAGATVQLASADAAGRVWTVLADSAGRYRIEEIPTGIYLLGFFHPKLDSLGLNSSLTRVVVRNADPVRLNLTTPSAQTIFASVCGRPMGKDSVGMFLGHVRSARGRVGVSGAAVSVKWSELLIRRDGMYRETPSLEAKTAESGWFAMCGLPIGTPLLVRAGAEADSSGNFEIEVPKSGLLARDVFVGRGERVMVAVGDSAALAGSTDTLMAELLRGNGRVRGRVASPVGAPARGARIAVWGTGAETRAGDDGQFALAALPTGTHTLDVRAVGFEPARVPVDVIEDDGGATAIELATVRIGLDTVRVTATRLYSSRTLAEYERRKQRGMGYFLDGEQLERRYASVATDLLRTIPGVTVLPGAYGEKVIMRGGLAILGPGYCTPDVILDGMRVHIDDQMPLNSVVNPQDIRAVEVYSRTGQIPVEFQSMTGCGSIVIWTGARPTAGATEVAKQKGKKR